ncbi:N-acetylmuramic acid 6-phosphate etherase [Tepidimicrobium xylanilyticum]|uniref:N-acetylmuramic acid 6-phosphate etherase n=1 Tax=Tepidimicrobium xylanilyticum TaxID=1123352 RepID=A0A1H2QL05_9FIRM|nr:N-acetylmuramic acid 6-phosphate etherase [Tepidimicrobium xylanilyticum]SDW07831.1 N-acetylmuramic acid 6-phosphate etherase [Tepidimicrobium xylanilyticum]
MLDLSKMSTEQINERTQDLDILPIREALEIMNEEDQKVAIAVKKEIPQIEKAVKAVIETFNNSGRLIYVGAGTSGRLGVLDAVECPPTFGTPPEMVQGLIAGGEEAFVKAIEGAEDSMELGADDLKNIGLNSKDIVVGIAASGRTPYVKGALNYAKEIGCKTVAIACNKNSEIGAIADIAIEVVVGPEVLAGSTRLKAGTAQKLVLNMISTISMVGLGKAYKNLMVDVQLNNIKLQSRAENIVVVATGVDRKIARETLEKAGGSVKLAITMILLNCDREEAEKKLAEANGHIRKIIT